MKMQRIITSTETQTKLWMKKITWMLPLFFLAKGLMWLALPVFMAFYGLN